MLYALKSTDPVKLGPYRLAGRLGTGGMGVVYLGVSPTADRFAVKVITPGLVAEDEFRARFAIEVETLKTVTGSRVARLERANLDDTPLARSGVRTRSEPPTAGRGQRAAGCPDRRDAGSPSRRWPP